MSDTPTRFPLAWPAGRPRKTSRKAGQFNFKEEDGRGYFETKQITISRAMDRLDRELGLLGAQSVVLSTNVDVTLQGRPRSSAAEPSDPGVALYFMLKGKPMTMACDTFTRVAQNIAALAAHIEATRKIERIGVATAAETLQAFTALPPPPAPKTPWWEVLAVPRTADAEYVNAIYKVLAKRRAHDPELLKELNVARDEALSEIAPKALT